MSTPARSMVLALILAALLPASAGAKRLFTAHCDLYYGPVGRPLTYSVTAGDVNGDGRDDLVYTAADFSYDGLLCTRLGVDGDLLENIPRSSPLGPETEDLDLRLANVDTDTKLDVVVASSDSIRILLGNGDGTFAPPIRLPGFGEKSQAAVGDLSGDGLADLAIPDPPNDRLQLFIGDGNGGFTTGASYAVGDRPLHCSVVDANGDPYPDILVGDLGGSLLLRGAAGGTFTSIPVGLDDAVPAGDLDGDGFQDAIGPDGAVLGNGDGTFQAPLPHGMPNLQPMADLNEDGLPDLIGMDNSSKILVQLGNGDGTFGVRREYSRFLNHIWLTSGDFDGDGHRDLAGVQEPGLQNVFRGRGDGEFVQAPTLSLPSTPLWVALGDLDGNALPDIVVGSSSSIGVALAAAPLTYPAFTTYPAAGGTRVETGDLNGDGRADVVALGGGSLGVWLANANGTLGPRVDYATAASELDVADLDGDGDLDVVVNGLPARIFPNDGTGSLGPPVSLPVNLFFDVDAADLNGDAWLDLVGENNISNAQVLLATGPLLYPASQTYFQSFAASPWTLEVGRFDANAGLDIAVGDAGSFDLYAGQAGGGFASATNVKNLGGANRINLESADFDANGFDDLVKPGQYYQVIAMRSNGDGTFTQERYGVNSAGTAVAVGDLDGNGRPDVISVEASTLTATLLINQTLSPPVDVPPRGLGPRELAIRPLLNPVWGALQLVIDLPSREPLTIDLVDVTGRRVAHREWRSLEPGRQMLDLGSLAGRSAGILFVRAQQGGKTGTTRIALIP